MKVRNYLSIAIFAFFGGISRFLLNQAFSFTGTISANLVGCFLLSFLTYYVIERQRLAQWLTLGLGTGFVGAFTTFSTLMLDVYKLGSNLDGLLYLALSLIGGFSATFLGFICANLLTSKESSKC